MVSIKKESAAADEAKHESKITAKISKNTKRAPAKEVMHAKQTATTKAGLIFSVKKTKAGLKNAFWPTPPVFTGGAAVYAAAVAECVTRFLLESALRGESSTISQEDVMAGVKRDIGLRKLFRGMPMNGAPGDSGEPVWMADGDGKSENSAEMILEDRESGRGTVKKEPGVKSENAPSVKRKKTSRSNDGVDEPGRGDAGSDTEEAKEKKKKRTKKASTDKKSAPKKKESDGPSKRKKESGKPKKKRKPADDISDAHGGPPAGERAASTTPPGSDSEDRSQHLSKKSKKNDRKTLGNEHADVAAETETPPNGVNGAEKSDNPERETRTESESESESEPESEPEPEPEPELKAELEPESKKEPEASEKKTGTHEVEADVDDEDMKFASDVVSSMTSASSRSYASGDEESDRDK